MSDEQQPTIPENAPWWSKAIEVVLHTGGISLLLVLFWMGQQAGWIPNPMADELKEVVERLDKVDAGMLKINDGMQQDAGHAIRHDSTTQQMIEHLSAVSKRDQMRCVLDAKTDQEKKACFPTKD